MYGLKQASNSWNKKFTDTLKYYDLEQLLTDRCIFKNKDSTIILAIHVDDGIMFRKYTRNLEDLLEKLKNVFEITFNKNPNSFLGLEIEKQKDKISINQHNYCMKILQVYGMNNASRYFDFSKQ